MVASGIAAWLSCVLAEVNGGERDVAVGRVDVQLVAGPMDAIALGVLLDPPRAVAGELGRHLRQALAGLALQAALGRRRLPFLALARPAALAWAQLVPGAAGGALARLNGGTSRATWPTRWSPWCATTTACSLGVGGRELGEGTAEGRLARHRARSAPAAKPPQDPAQALDQAERVVDVEDRLGEKGARERRAIGTRPAGPAMHMGPGARHLQGDELAVAFTERPEFFLQGWETFGFFANSLIVSHPEASSGVPCILVFLSRTRFPWTQNWLNRSVQGGPEHDRQF